MSVSYQDGLVGKSERRIEDPRFLQGKGKFVDDIHFPGMLHAHFVRSPVAHGLLKKIDIEDARAMPGVRGLFTYADLRSWNQMDRIPAATPAAGINFEVSPSVLVEREMTYVGEPVVLIVADSRAQAEDAAEAVLIDYEELTPQVDAKTAAGQNAVLTRTDCPHNVAAENGIKFGEIEDAFANAELTVSETFKVHKGGVHAIETRGVVARFDPVDDLLTVWENSQMPHRSKHIISTALGLRDTQLRVLTRDVGGGFGGKGVFHPENLAIPTAAMIMGRPIKWIEDRYESFLSCTLELMQEWDVDAAFDQDGRLRGVKGTLYHEHGANTPYGVAVPYNACTNLIGPYVLPAYDIRILLCMTNKPPSTATRGAGRPQGTFVMERLLDRAADRLKIPRDEIRRRNFISSDHMPFSFPVYNRDGSPMVYDTGDYPECQRRALEIAAAGDFEQRRDSARAEGRLIGLGVANYVEATGRGPYESGDVRVDPSGRVVVKTGASSQGQGTETTLAQIAADVFGMSTAEIEVICGDTAATPLGLGAYASRQAVTAGSAVRLAAEKVAKKAYKAAAIMLGVPVDDVALCDGEFVVRGLAVTAEKRNYPSVSLRDVGAALSGTPGFALPQGMEPGLAASVDFQPEAMTYSNGCHVVEAEVDQHTGIIKLNRYIVVHDCGRLINPQLVDGQVLGGVVHGIGATLFEWMRYDSQGQPLSATYADYLLPSSDVVPRIEIAHMESPTPLNPLGVKGAGEAGTIAAPAAIVSAVEDALKPSDVFVSQLPLTPNRLLELLAHGKWRTQ